ncbi:MAG: hypothetical protein FJ255_03995 [Phycisphaerae bacterium]|nr:hypothetical protein [Phycisphaerae bacterium]
MKPMRIVGLVVGLTAALGAAAHGQWHAPLLALPAAVTAQSPPAPEDLFARHMREIGGADKLAAVKSREVRGIVRNASTGFVGRIVAQTAPPNLVHTMIEAPGITSWDTVFNGEIAWTRTVVGETTILQGDEAADLRFNSYFHAEVEAGTRFAKLETVEQLNWNERPTFRVRGTAADGRIHDTMFDAESGMIYGLISYRMGAQGPQPFVTLIVSDYKEFGGLKSPGRIVQRREGQDGEFVTTVTGVTLDSVDPAVFKADSDVQRAIDSGGRWPPKKAGEAPPPPISGPASNPAGPGQPK